MSFDPQSQDYRPRPYGTGAQTTGTAQPFVPDNVQVPAKMNCANCGGNEFRELPTGGFVCTHCGTRYDEFVSRYQADEQAKLAAWEAVSVLESAQPRKSKGLVVFGMILVIAVAVIAVFAIVIGAINHSARSSFTYDESDFNTNYIVDTPIIMDNELCTVTLQGYVGIGPSLEMVFLVTSNVEDVQVEVSDVVVNGYAVTGYSFAYLGDSHERQMTVYLDYSTMQLAAPDGPTQITLRVVSTDGNLSAHEITSDIADSAGVHVAYVTLYPTGKTAADVVVVDYPLPEGAVTLVDEQGIFATVLYCGNDVDSDSRTIDYGLYLENDTDERLALELGNVRVDGAYTQNSEVIILPPHTRAVRHLTFWLADGSTLADDAPNTVEFSYVVRHDAQFSENLMSGSITLLASVFEVGQNPRYQLP